MSTTQPFRSPPRRLVVLWILTVATLIAGMAWTVSGTGSPTQPVPALAQAIDCSGAISNGGFESPALTFQGTSPGNADGWAGTNHVVRDDANAHSGNQVGVASPTLIKTLDISGLQVGDTITISFWHDLAVTATFEGNSTTTGSNGSRIWGQASISHTLTTTTVAPVIRFQNVSGAAYMDDVTATCTRGITPTVTPTPTITPTPAPPYSVTITDFSCAGPLQQTGANSWIQTFNFTVQISPDLREGDSLALSSIVFTGPAGYTYAGLMPQLTETPSGVTGTRMVEFTGSAPSGPMPFATAAQIWKAGFPSEVDEASVNCDGLTASPTPDGPTSTPTQTPTVTPTSTATLPPQDYTVTITDFSCAGPLQQTSASTWEQQFNFTVQNSPDLRGRDSRALSPVLYVGLGQYSVSNPMSQLTQTPSGATGTRYIVFSGSAPTGPVPYRVGVQMWSSGWPGATDEADVVCDGFVPTTPTATATTEPPTSTPTNTATSTATSTPTNTVAAPTSTSVPPTSTATSTPTNTPTPTATSTTVPPTATSTTVPPTATSTIVPPTATNTTMPPTATSTTVPPTSTTVPPTTVPLPTLAPPSNTTLTYTIDPRFPYTITISVPNATRYVVKTPPANGKVTVQPNGQFTYQSTVPYLKSDSFTIQVSGPGGTATVTVNLTYQVDKTVPSGGGKVQPRNTNDDSGGTRPTPTPGGPREAR